MDRETDDQTKQQWQFRLVGIWSCYGVGQHELPPPVLRLLVQHDGPAREESPASTSWQRPLRLRARAPRGPVLAPSAAVTAKATASAMTNSKSATCTRVSRPTRRPRADGTHARQGSIVMDKPKDTRIYPSSRGEGGCTCTRDAGK